MQTIEQWIRLTCDDLECNMWASVRSVPTNSWWHGEGKDYCPNHNGVKKETDVKKEVKK